MLLHPFQKFLYAPESGAATAVAEKPDADAEAVESEAEDTEDSGAEAEAEPEAEATDEAPAAPSLGEVFKQHNLSGLPEDPTALAEQWRSLNAKAQEAEQLRQQLVWLAYQQNQQAQQAQQQKAPEKPKLPWEIPEYDPSWVNMVKRDEDGNLVPIPGALPDLPQKINNYARAREQAIDKFLRDPYGVMQGGIQDFVQQQAAQIAQQYVVQYAEQSYLAQEKDKHGNWMFEPNGQFTYAGNLWNNYYVGLRQQGFPHWQAGAMAHKALSGDLYEWQLQNQTQTQAQAPQKSDAEKKLEFLKGAAKTNNRSGTSPRRTKESPPQNGSKDPWKTLREQLKDKPDSYFADEEV